MDVVNVAVTSSNEHPHPFTPSNTKSLCPLYVVTSSNEHPHPFTPRPRRTLRPAHLRHKLKRASAPLYTFEVATLKATIEHHKLKRVFPPLYTIPTIQQPWRSAVSQAQTSLPTPLHATLPLTPVMTFAVSSSHEYPHPFTLMYSRRPLYPNVDLKLKRASAPLYMLCDDWGIDLQGQSQAQTSIRTPLHIRIIGSCSCNKIVTSSNEHPHPFTRI